MENLSKPIAICQVRGITPELAAALAAAGITETVQFLAATCDAAARRKLAAQIGADEPTILLLAQRADLMRIPGVAGIYLALLEHVGVDTVTELRRRVPENLYTQLLTAALHYQIQPIPRLDEIQRWVQQAKQLERTLY